MDDELLWKSAIKDVPALKKFCEEELKKEGRPVESWIAENAEQ